MSERLTVLLIVGTMIAFVITACFPPGWEITLKKAEQRQTPVPSIILTPKSYPSPLVAIFVDEFTYNSIQGEIQQYRADIEKDLNAKVVIFAQEFRKPEEIRNKLLELKNQGLAGAVLIGDIPTTYLKARLDEPGLVTVPTDFYYMDLGDDFTIDEDGVFEYFAKPLSLLPEIWIGRLKPPVSGEEGISLLKRYFQRNHAYRTGETRPVKEMLIFDPIGVKGIPNNERARYLEDVDRLIERIGLYDPSKATVVFSADIALDLQDYLNKLKQDFELAYLNLHGTPTTQQIGSSGISAEEIRRLEPKPYFYLIWSCSSGDFTKKDYIAGSYLFYGNGLVVLASTAPVLGNIESGASSLFPLSLGATFGEAYKYANYLSSMTLLGDPTLRMRERPGLTPELLLERTEIDFGEALTADIDYIGPLEEGPGFKEVRIRVENTGEAPLTISPVPSYGYYLRDGRAPEEAEAGPVSFIFPDQIEPGMSNEIIFTFLPTKEGDYVGFEALYTNDPEHILVVISFKGKGIKA